MGAQQLCQKAFPAVPACQQSVFLVFLVLSVHIFSDWSLLFSSTSGNCKRSESVLTGLLDLSRFSNLLLMQPQKGNKPRPNRDLWQLVLVHGCLWSDEWLWPAFRRRCQLLRPGSCGNAEHEVQNSREKPCATKKNRPYAATSADLILLLSYFLIDGEPILICSALSWDVM